MLYVVFPLPHGVLYFIKYCCETGSLISSLSRITYLHFFKKLTFIRTQGFHEQKSLAVQMKKMILLREHFPASQLPGLQMAAFPSSSNTPTPTSHTSLFCTHRQTWGPDVLCVCCLWSSMCPHTHSHCLVIGHVFVSLNSLCQQFLL